jgi:hypothetical protein
MRAVGVWSQILLLTWHCGLPRDIVRRQPRRVHDIRPYGEELRSQELNPPEPQGPVPPYSVPGHYLRWTADHSWAATTADAGGYFRTISVWSGRDKRLTQVISIKDADPESGRAYRYAWSRDSKALLIYGSGSLPTEDGSGTVFLDKICLVYLPDDGELYRLESCERTQWAY